MGGRGLAGVAELSGSRWPANPHPYPLPLRLAPGRTCERAAAQVRREYPPQDLLPVSERTVHLVKG